VGLGGACITLGLLLVQWLQRRAGPEGTPAQDITGDLLVAALLAGIAIAGLFGWRRSRGVEGVWQRGVVAVLAVFGALMVAFFFTIPARQLLGSAGLVILGALLAIVGVMGSRWAIRGQGMGDAGPGAGGGS
jgi:peptidoglycan/LPS O-acetylase OafA/YrhL